MLIDTIGTKFLITGLRHPILYQPVPSIYLKRRYCKVLLAFTEHSIRNVAIASSSIQDLESVSVGKLVIVLKTVVNRTLLVMLQIAVKYSIFHNIKYNKYPIVICIGEVL